MKNWKKLFSLLLSLLLVGSLLPGALAEDPEVAEPEDPAPLAEVISVKEDSGFTTDYCNIHSAHIDNPAQFYEDYFNTRVDSLQGSLTQGWLTVGLGMLRKENQSWKYCDDSVFDNAYQVLCKGAQDSSIEFNAARWQSDGTLFAVLYLQKHAVALDLIISDIAMVALLPEDDGDTYVSTTGESTEDGEITASSIKNDTESPVSATQTLSQTTTASVSSSVSHSSSYTFGESVTVGMGFGLGVLGKANVGAGFTAGQAVQDGWSTSESQSKSETVSNTLSITLPAHTQAMIHQGETTTIMKTRYNCPVALRYKVTIKGPSKYLLLKDKTFSPDARKDLYQRAIVSGSKAYDPEGIDWEYLNGFSEYRTMIDALSYQVPMSGTGASLIQRLNVHNTVADGLMPLYPLDKIRVKAPNISFISSEEISYGYYSYLTADMVVGDSSYTNYLSLLAQDTKGAEYYGFNPGYGHWVVADKDGHELTGEQPVELSVDAYGNTEYKAVRAGTCYLKYVINEDCYATADDLKTFRTNKDLKCTAALKINVTEPPLNATAEITGSYTGKTGAAPEKIEGKGKLTVMFLDETDKEVEVPYTWDQRELPSRGIDLKPDGTVTFSQSGTFHVRVKSGSYYSPWVEITATGDDTGETYQDMLTEMKSDWHFAVVGTPTFLASEKQQSLLGKSGLRITVLDSTDKERAVKFIWEAKEPAKDGITVTEDGNATFTRAGTFHVRVRSGKIKSRWIEIAVSGNGKTITVEGVIYKLDQKTGTAAVTGAAKDTITKIVIPKQLKISGKQYKVTTIKAKAFRKLKKLKTVIMLGNVQTIGKGAFSECPKLSSVTLPASLVTIEAEAFEDCDALTAITIPSKVKNIGKKAFFDCGKLKLVTIQTKKLTESTVGAKAFTAINKKATVKVPAGKLKLYTTLLLKKGITKDMTITK